MSDIDETSDDVGGSLADAIAAHLELKKEHGADPEELDRELETALAPANRDEDDSVDLRPASEETASEAAAEDAPPAATEPEPAPARELPSEPATVVEPEPEPEPEPALQSEPEPEPVPTPAEVITPEPESAVEPEPVIEPEPAEAAPANEPAPGEITGTIEFEWDKDAEEAAAAASTAEPVDHDLLEDTPDFFEETPEHDKLWFDEAPPRKFDF